MKKLFKALGITSLYFLLYVGIQFMVSIIFVIIVSMQLAIKMMVESGDMDSNLLTQQATDQTLKYAMLMIIIGGILFLLALWLVFFVRKKNYFQGISLKKIQIKSIVPLIFIGVSFNLVISGVMALIPFPKSWLDSYMESYSATESGNVVIAIIATVLMAPIVEEVIFRGLIYARLKRGMPIAFAAVISSVIFGLMHGNLIWGSYAFVLGLVLVWTFERFKSITANILVHFSFNLAGVLLGYVTEIPDVLGWIILGVSACVLVLSVIWIKNITKNGYNVKVIKC